MLIFRAFGLFCVLLSTSVISGADQNGDLEVKIMDGIFRNYSNKARPPGRGPTVVTVNVYLRNLNFIDDIKREYSVQSSFRMEWKDERLRYHKPMELKNGYLSLTSSRMIWLPDIFFRNEKQGHLHDIVMPNVFARIYPDGKVLYSIRLSLTLACPMNLRKFPFDTPNCTMSLASYGMTTNDIICKWKSDDPIQISETFELDKFSLEKYETGTCDSKTNTGLYSCLRLDLLFKREFAYYLVHVYIPCTFLVIIAWLSFWLAPKQVEVRVQITLLTNLIMALGIGLLNNNLPKTSYTKAFDVWTGVCLTFVMSALCETIVVNFLWKGSGDGDSGEPTKRHSSKLDIVCRVLYPAAFIVFVIIYFAVY